MDFIEKLKSLIASHYNDARVELDPVPGSERVTGSIIWTGFNERSHAERQRELSDWIRKELPPHEAIRVSVITTLTPEEIADEDAA